MTDQSPDVVVPLRRAQAVPMMPSGSQETGLLIRFPRPSRPNSSRPSAHNRRSILGHHPDCPIPHQHLVEFCTICQGIRKGHL